MYLDLVSKGEREYVASLLYLKISENLRETATRETNSVLKR
jgi:hypothetical protein